MNDSFSPVEKLRMTKSNVAWIFSAGENLRGSNVSNSNPLSGTDVNAYLKKVRINWEANYRLANPFSYRIDGAMTKLFSSLPRLVVDCLAQAGIDHLLFSYLDSH